MAAKKIIIIAGPNGAGKTTFACSFLPAEANLPRFINADLIAAGLAPFTPETAAVKDDKAPFYSAGFTADSRQILAGPYEAQLRRWNALAPGQAPSVCEGVSRCHSALELTIGNLEILASVLSLSDLNRRPIPELHALTRALAADTTTPYRLPKLIQIEERLSELGLGNLLEEIRKQRPDPRTWPQLLEYAWLAS